MPPTYTSRKKAFLALQVPPTYTSRKKAFLALQVPFMGWSLCAWDCAEGQWIGLF